jgi:hypothetical protein
MLVRPHHDVLVRRLNPGAVLVHLGQNVIYELNSTGAAVWDLVQEGVPVDEIPARLEAAFAVSPDEARREVAALVDALRREGLLES